MTPGPWAQGQALGCAAQRQSRCRGAPPSGSMTRGGSLPGPAGRQQAQHMQHGDSTACVGLLTRHAEAQVGVGRKAAVGRQHADVLRLTVHCSGTQGGRTLPAAAGTACRAWTPHRRLERVLLGEADLACSQAGSARHLRVPGGAGHAGRAVVDAACAGRACLSHAAWVQSASAARQGASPTKSESAGPSRA